MNQKGVQLEGFDFSEYVALPFVVAVPAQYVVGTTANAVLAGSWPNEGGLPAEAQTMLLLSDQDCEIQIVPLKLIQRQLFPVANPLFIVAGLPVAQFVPQNTPFRLPDKAVILYVTSLGVNGTLNIWLSG